MGRESVSSEMELLGVMVVVHVGCMCKRACVVCSRFVVQYYYVQRLKELSQPATARQASRQPPDALGARV